MVRISNESNKTNLLFILISEHIQTEVVSLRIHYLSIDVKKYR